MTYSDDYNIRTKNVKFNDVADAIDGVITRSFAGTTTGTSSAYISSPSPAWQSYIAAAIIIITPHVTNAAGATIQINSLAAKELRIAGVAITAGVLQIGVPTILAYTGTYFEVLLQSVSAPTTPVGQITAYAGASAPTGWLMCDGSSQSTTGPYAALHGIIGYTYGGSGGSFNLPDLRRRTPVGTGASDTLGASDGLTYGVSTRPITHSHSVPAHYHSVGAGATLSVDISHTHGTGSITGTVGGTDGTHTHTITDPGHIHGNDRRASATAFGNAIAIAFPTTSGTFGTFNSNSNTTGISVTSTSSGHGHGHSLTATLGTTAKIPSGTIGLVTGGVNGNAAMTSGPTSHPHLFVNYIIKF